MKKYHLYILTSLVISLVIYITFRSDNIVINQILFKITPINYNYSSNIPDFIIYNLPQGFWVFSVTLISKNLYFKKINLAYLPLFFSFYIELIQYLNLTNGTFDYWDLIAATLGFFISNNFIECPYKKQNILSKFNLRTIVFFFSYIIVVLSIYNVNHYFLNN